MKETPMTHHVHQVSDCFCPWHMTHRDNIPTTGLCGHTWESGGVTVQCDLPVHRKGPHEAWRMRGES